jgi:hypothetical protein
MTSIEAEALKTEVQKLGVGDKRWHGNHYDFSLLFGCTKFTLKCFAVLNLH